MQSVSEYIGFTIMNNHQACSTKLDSTMIRHTDTTNVLDFGGGTTQVFRPFGVKKLLELPLHIQDTALFYSKRMGLTQPHGVRAVEDMLTKTKEIGGVLTVNWHQRSLGPERLWDDSYRHVVRLIDNSAIWSATAHQVVEWFAQRQSVEFNKVDSGRGQIKVTCKRNTAVSDLLLRTLNYSAVGMLRDHGQSKKYYHDVIGWNARMDGIQGAVLSIKLKHLKEWNEARRKNAGLYNELLSEINGIITPNEANYGKHIYHIYSIRVKNRNELIGFLKKKDIYSGIHYPVPVHLQNAYKFLGLRNSNFPVSEKCAQEFVSLPMFAELSEEQIIYVYKTIRDFSD